MSDWKSSRVAKSETREDEPDPALDEGEEPTLRRENGDRPPADRPMISIADFKALCTDGPLRSPDFRWQLAVRWMAGYWFPAERWDPWVRRAAQYLKRREQDQDLQHPIDIARRIRESEPEWRRIQIEGLLLAGVSFERIADKTGWPVTVVEAYEALFYAIAGSLKATSYIIHIVIGLHTPAAENDLGTYIRVYAFNGGEHILEACLDAFAPELGYPYAEPNPSRELRAQRRVCREAIATDMTPVTPRNRVRWMRLYLLYLESKLKSQQAE